MIEHAIRERARARARRRRVRIRAPPPALPARADEALLGARLARRDRRDAARRLREVGFIRVGSAASRSATRRPPRRRRGRGGAAARRDRRARRAAARARRLAVRADPRLGVPPALRRATRAGRRRRTAVARRRSPRARSSARARARGRQLSAVHVRDGLREQTATPGRCTRCARARRGSSRRSSRCTTASRRPDAGRSRTHARAFHESRCACARTSRRARARAAAARRGARRSSSPRPAFTAAGATSRGATTSSRSHSPAEPARAPGEACRRRAPTPTTCGSDERVDFPEACRGRFRAGRFHAEERRLLNGARPHRTSSCG